MAVIHLFVDTTILRILVTMLLNALRCHLASEQFIINFASSIRSLFDLLWLLKEL
jgi:hypothetical protein